MFRLPLCQHRRKSFVQNEKQKPMKGTEAQTFKNHRPAAGKEKPMKGTEAQTVKNRRPAVGKEKPMKNTKAKLLKTAARLSERKNQ